MTTSQYFLNLALRLLAWIISSNVGTRTLSRRRLTVPLFIVASAGWFYLKDLPSVGNDGQLELFGLAVGVLLGVVAALTVRVHRDGERVLATAGAAFVAIWVAVIGGRVMFAYGAEHWFARDIGEFSRVHLITGADAWTAAFVIMALAMVVSRLAVTGLRAARLPNHSHAVRWRIRRRRQHRALTTHPHDTGPLTHDTAECGRLGEGDWRTARLNRPRICPKASSSPAVTSWLRSRLAVRSSIPARLT